MWLRVGHADRGAAQSLPEMQTAAVGYSGAEAGREGEVMPNCDDLLWILIFVCFFVGFVMPAMEGAGREK